MKYKESERERALQILATVIKAEGNGVFKNKNYPFVLTEPQKNLYRDIRREAITYFDKHKIAWWNETDESKSPDTVQTDDIDIKGKKKPTGHILSSQVACVNHLFFLRQNKEAATKILKNLYPAVVEACNDFDEGYVGFEVVNKSGKGSYLKEGDKLTRGANCTSVDAMMCGKLNDGKKILFLIEWKYTETYSPKSLLTGKPGETRSKRYVDFINHPDSPFTPTVSIENFFYEPFYQLMRQTLLAWKLTENAVVEFGNTDYMHIEVIPENNIDLRYTIPAPGLKQFLSIEEAWKAQLKSPEKYSTITPQRLLKPLLFEKTYQPMINYLNARYW